MAFRNTVLLIMIVLLLQLIMLLSMRKPERPDNNEEVNADAKANHESNDPRPIQGICHDHYLDLVMNKWMSVMKVCVQYL